MEVLKLNYKLRRGYVIDIKKIRGNNSKRLKQGLQFLYAQHSHSLFYISHSLMNIFQGVLKYGAHWDFKLKPPKVNN